MKKVVFLYMTLISCGSNNDKHSFNGYNPYELDEAWKTKDTAVVLKWINSLGDSTIDDTSFYDITASLGVTGFVYGNSDLSDKGNYKMIPPTIRKIRKKKYIQCLLRLF